MRKLLKIVLANLLFFLIFGLVALAFLEGGLRVFRSMDDTSVSAVGIPIYQSDERHTYSHIPGAIARNGYGEPTPEIRINNLGIRDEDFDETSPKKNILMLGDSFTFGTGVGQEETFSEILETDLGSDYDVWNAGHIGQSIGNYYLWLKKYAALMKLNAVVVNIFVGNDITELRRKNWGFDSQTGDLMQVRDLKVFANDEGKLESWESREPKFYSLWWLEKRWNVLAHKLKLKDPRTEEPTLTWPVFLAQSHPGWDPNLPEYWTRFMQGMELIENFGANHDIPIIFALIPMDVQVSPSYETKYAILQFDEEAREADRPQSIIAHWCELEKANCADPLKMFRERTDKDRLYFSHNADPHFDRLGHQVYAEFLQEALKPILK
ncbi:MAG TPA: hypothetical protein VIT68_04530 [Candidatus Gracilibacteria bacterium]